MSRRHISERDANVAMAVLLLLACVGVGAIVRWVAAFVAALFTAAVAG